MCYMNLQKNVRSRNFEFLTQSIFTWGQTLLKSKKPKTRYFFAIQFSPAVHLERIRTQLFYIFNRNSKILIFDRMRAKNAIIYANFDINSKNIQFYQSFAPFYQSYYNKDIKIYWYRILEHSHNMTLVVRPRSTSQGSTELSKWAYFAHFRKLLLGFLSDYHQNWGRCAIWTYKKI